MLRYICAALVLLLASCAQSPSAPNTYGVQMKNGDGATLVRVADSFVPLN